MFKPTDRDNLYYFSPDPDLYECYYSQFHDMFDLFEVKAAFVEKINVQTPSTATEAKEFYKEALANKKKVIKASNPNPYRKGLSEEEMLNLHLILADTIDEEIITEKPLFKRVAKNSISLFRHRKIYGRIKRNINS